MGDLKMCRICMAKENLTSVFSIMDGGRISDKINFVCGLTISSSDGFPKLICHQCLSSIIIASSIKRKSLETDRIFHEMISSDNADFIENFADEEDEDEPLLIEASAPTNSRYLVYEEDPNATNQPKMNYNLTDSSVRINNMNHFNYNLDLKHFVENYLDNKPNLELIKITDPSSIKDIESVLAMDDSESRVKRPKTDRQSYTADPHERSNKNSSAAPDSSRLLNALSGRRFGQISVSRIQGSAYNITDRKNANYRQ